MDYSKPQGYIFVFQYNGNTEAPKSLQDALARMGPVVVDAQDGTEWQTLAEIAGVSSTKEIAPFITSEGTPYFSDEDRQKVLDDVRREHPRATFA